jgi:hypothetical protein
MIFTKCSGGQKGGCSDLASWGRGVPVGLVVEGAERALGACLVEFTLRLHIPYSTGSFKLDWLETGTTKVCVSS